MGEPKLSIDTHHPEENDLLEYQSFISSMVVDTVVEHQKLLSQQSSTDKPSTDDHPSMVNTSITIPSTDTHYPLTAYTSMDIPSTSNPTLSDIVLSNLGTTYDEQIVCSTLLILSEGEKQLSDGLGCSHKKREVEDERPLISSDLASEKEGSSLAAELKGEGEESEPG